ncbi:DUF4194 domain-containing protein [Gulosibacter hominis]|uniref:DUF4194 domain-containing protein n=1 Tax=Gulosibacter hominis TaxID=2770504 RepID=UPI001919E0C0|nr:DUF4194 domain-containing protein [Gulosibacter hominis]
MSEIFDAPNSESDPSDFEPTDGLWRGDTGQLAFDTRRVFLELLKGPYVSGERSPQLWAALVADERLIRSRLHELFLDLVMDKSASFAFTRRVVTNEIEVASALRSEKLRFIDTAMLLALRQQLLAAPGQPRVFVGKEEICEQLAAFQQGDAVTFKRSLNAAWKRMVDKLRVLHKSGEDRYEISPMMRFLIDEERVQQLSEAYTHLARQYPADDQLNQTNSPSSPDSSKMKELTHE